MAVVVKIPTQLRTLTDGLDRVEADGRSLKQVLDALENAHPGLQKRVLDDAGQLRRFVNVYVDGEDVRFDQGVRTPVEDGAVVQVLPSVAGG